jgi:hypothetical protein
MRRRRIIEYNGASSCTTPCGFDHQLASGDTRPGVFDNVGGDRGDRYAHLDDRPASGGRLNLEQFGRVERGATV